jgi:hypothetical protein
MAAVNCPRSSITSPTDCSSWLISGLIVAANCVPESSSGSNSIIDGVWPKVLSPSPGSPLVPVPLSGLGIVTFWPNSVVEAMADLISGTRVFS